MKKILLLLLGVSCSSLALEHNPIAPPQPNVVDKFGVNLQSGQLSHQLKTIAIGGERGLSHHVQLYTDLKLGEGYGFIDAFAGSADSTQISTNVVQILTDSSGNVRAIRDTGSPPPTSFTELRVMRVYGPAGSQDFLVYKNGQVDHNHSSTSGYVYKPVGDIRHSLVESADTKFLTWTTPSGIQSKYERASSSGNTARAGAVLKEVIYPDGFKIRVGYKAVSTNTGFMLKYDFTNSPLSKIPRQVIGINRANQYCAEEATSCATAGWPVATFTWPTGIPNVFHQPGLPLSSYLVTMTTPDGVTDIQYQPENVCITEFGNEVENCTGSHTKWHPRLRSIRTPESNVPNYEYTYKNLIHLHAVSGLGYWKLASTSGQITSATLNGTDTQSYSGPTSNPSNSTITRGNIDTWAVTSQYEQNVIESVTDTKSGTYTYHKDARHLLEKYNPVAGRGPNQHYYYDSRGNLSQIKAIEASGNQILLKNITYPTTCTHPKTCNQPLSITDALGNVTDYEYDPQGRFGSPIKITQPPNKHGERAATVYHYEPMYASYKRSGETISQDPDPIWLLTSEHTCRKTAITETGCAGGNLDKVLTTYYYGPQNSGQPNNLLLRGKSITAEGASSTLETRVWCYEYDRYGKLIGETAPKGNSSNLQSCN
jgi:YD repeat-containing protein